MVTIPSWLQIPAGFNPQLWEKHGATLLSVAEILNLKQFHHLGVVVEEPHPKATFVESTSCWVGPVENGVETLHFPDAEKRAAYARPHYCFAVHEVEPYLTPEYPVLSTVNGPLGPATFINVKGETVELLQPID